MKEKIIHNICYTDLVYGRINKKLRTQYSNQEIESFVLKILKETDEKCYSKIGKNYYIENTENNVRLTVNSYTFRIITADTLGISK